MIILALDTAKVTGWAYGDGNNPPQSGSVRLVSDNYEYPDLAASMDKFLSGICESNGAPPDLIALEEYQHPTSQMSGAAVITSIMLYGVVCATAGRYHVPLVTCTVATWRKAFCGKSTALPSDRRGGAEVRKEDKRRANKKMVLDRAKALGWLPADCADDNRADAVGIWSWTVASYHKYDPANPPTLEMFHS